MRVKLGDICEYVKGKTPVSELTDRTYISTENMLPNKMGITSASSLPTVDQTQIYKEKDILVSNIRPYFKKIWQAEWDGGCSADVLVFRAKQGVFQDYLYFVLSDDRFFEYSMATSKGTKMPRGDKTSIMQYEIEVPSYDEQVKIASVLSDLEAKIKLNSEINSNLEQQAQALYRNLFIDNCHSDWEIGKLSDLITVRYGKDHKKLEDGIYPVYGSGGIMRYVEKPIYDLESVLIPRKGSLNNVMYVNEPFWSVDTMFYTEMKKPNIAKFVYHFVKSKDLAALNAGSAVPSMTTDILNAMQLSIPDDATFEAFEIVISPLYEKIRYNVSENKKLHSLRDALLPKLMSGEIDLSSIDI